MSLPTATVLDPPDHIRSIQPPLPQYSRRHIAALWVAVTAPMGLLGWVVAPFLARHLHTADPFIDALVACFNIGLIWQIVLVAVIVRREQGSLRWARVRDALWLDAPRDPRSGRRGGRVWWWALVFVAISAAVNLLPIDPVGPLPRDFPHAITTPRVEHYFHGNWAGFAMMALDAFLAPIAEELVFRGLLLPRSVRAFGKGNVVWNGVLFTAYHVHQPWSMPATLIDGTLNQAWPSWRYRSTWLGLITHTAPSFLTVAVVLGLVVSR
jgi:uncharacterized protein